MPLVGTHPETGALISGPERLRWSIWRILTTPRGSRRMRPEFGSDCWKFVDMPVTPGWKVAFAAEVNAAIGRWEPEFKISSVTVLAVNNGVIELKISGAFDGVDTSIEVSV